MEPILVITNFPDKEGALALAQQLIDLRLAACVNVLGRLHFNLPLAGRYRNCR